MIKYKFDWLNGGLEIIDPKISWTFAGFSKIGTGKLTVNILLETPSAKFEVELSTSGQPTDRSDAAIEALMNKLLDQYKI